MAATTHPHPCIDCGDVRSVASNVTFRNVTFNGCGNGHYGDPRVEHTASIFIGECVPHYDQNGVPTTDGQPYTGAGAKVFSNWTVERCRFQLPAGRAAVHAISLNGMTFKNNTVAGVRQVPGRFFLDLGRFAGCA